MKATKSPLSAVEVEPLQHLNLLTATTVGLVQTANLNQARRIGTAIDSNHLQLLLPDWRLFTIVQIIGALDYK